MWSCCAQQPECTLPHPPKVYWKPLTYVWIYLHIMDTYSSDFHSNPTLKLHRTHMWQPQVDIILLCIPTTLLCSKCCSTEIPLRVRLIRAVLMWH